jgi:hypothetical protein
MRIVSTAALLVLVGCAGTGQIDLGVTASSQLAATVEGEEAPRLLVTVDRVDVHIGSDEADDGDEAGEAGWITVFTGPTEIDLRDAASAEVFLSSAEVPVGRVTAIVVFNRRICSLNLPISASSSDTGSWRGRSESAPRKVVKKLGTGG